MAQTSHLFAHKSKSLYRRSSRHSCNRGEKSAQQMQKA